MMQLRFRSGAVIALTFAFTSSACMSTDGTGATPGAGGASSSGGNANAAGTTGGSGGSTGSSGGASSGGGTGTSSGGNVGTGGTTSPGSTGDGGSGGSGGTANSGGTAGSGGVVSSGGSTVDGPTGTGGRGNPGARGGATGRGGATAAGGAVGTGGSSGRGGALGTGGSTVTGLAKFSFFVTSIEAMRQLSKNQNGFGGDLRYGEADGLAGADKICTEIAESSMAGSSAKIWRAFLSTTKPVNAVDRVGNGPWYDRIGRLVADAKANLIQTRPKADAAILNDLPNETGTPNHQDVDNHDVLTGSTTAGQIGSNTKTSTCDDWTSTSSSGFKPIIGHAWPRSGGGGGGDSASNWINAHTAPGCAPSVNLSNTMGGGSGGVGDGGGYGAIYCFALTP